MKPTEHTTNTRHAGTGLVAKLRAFVGARGIGARSLSSQALKRAPHMQGRGQRFAPAIAVLTLLAALAGASPASAQTAWWHVTSGARPTYLPAAVEEEGKVIPGKGQIVVTAENLGDGPLSGEVSIVDVLPEHLKATAMSYHAPGAQTLTPCAPLSSLTCTFSGSVAPYHQIEVLISVEVLPEAKSGSEEENHATVSGGTAATAEVSSPLTVSESSTPFGVEDYEMADEQLGGAPDTLAGSHPFQTTFTVNLNQKINQRQQPVPVALPKDVDPQLPPGWLGNPVPFPRCTIAQFLTFNATEDRNQCPAGTALGVATVHVQEPFLVGDAEYVLPVFNLPPSYGAPARLGFYVPEGHVPVYIDTAVRGGPGTGEPYALTANVHNISQTIGFLSSQVTIWGVPANPEHDPSRGWGCLHQAEGLDVTPCQPLEAQNPESFVTLPTSCPRNPLTEEGEPLHTSIDVDSWEDPSHVLTASTTLPALDGCNQLSFAPSFSAEPTTDSASSASGLNVSLGFEDEGLTSAEGRAQSQMEKSVVTLPEGFTINPSSGVGLGGCTPADFEREELNTLPGEGCPNDSTLGTVEASTPLLSTPIKGSLFIAQPYDNPFPEEGHPGGTLVALYIVLRNPETGILIKLPAKVTPNPVTGQLVTSVENEPQFPISSFAFHFREGTRAPLITPATCGTYTTSAALTPFSESSSPFTDLSSFTITTGVEGAACPAGGVAPFKPGIEAGTLNNNAGAFSPFYLHLTRGDADQEISGFSTDLPPGLTGNLTGIPFCPEADIALARTKTGAQEEASPSCPVASQVGHTLVGTGVGAVLAYVPGKIYLAGPFDGAPFSLVSVTSAVVGPFDLGTVVLRFGLNINPYTAQVSVSPTASEPIPTIIDGIVTHVRDIRVYVERPGNAPFALNPTSCDPMAIGSTLTAAEGASATIAGPFQVTNCQALKFAPKFAASTQAHTSKAEGASLHVNLTYPYGPQGTYADIAKVKVELPKQLPSRLTTLQKACTAKAFETNPASCPPESAIGTAKAVVPNIPEPLTGPVYFVSHGGEAFPSLEIVLQGYGVKVILVGATFISKTGITSTTFKAIPDNPVTSFELTFPEKQYSALAANGNLCTQKLTMPVDFTAQNGAEIKQNTHIEVEGCPNTISISSHKVKGKTTTLSVYVPAAGKLTATGKGLSSVTKTYSGQEAQTFTLTQKKGGKLKTKIKLTFTPSKGKKQSKTITISFKK